MKNSDYSHNFCNILVWVTVASLFATGAVIFSPRDSNELERTVRVEPENSIALEQQ
jgi:hypothetical protein